MNYTTARDNLVAHLDTALKAGYPSLPLFYENTTEVDLDQVGDQFLRISIDFEDALQSDMDLGNEGHRVFGVVTLQHFQKTGRGTRAGLSLFDFLTGLMKIKNLSGVHTGVPRPGRKEERAGWVSRDLICPFDFYSNY